MSDVSSIRVSIPLNVNDEPIGDILRRVAQAFDDDNMGFLESMGSSGVSNEHGEQLASVDLIYEDQEQLENAASGLLEALQLLVKYDGENCQDDTTQWGDVIEAAMSAIAKATGD